MAPLPATAGQRPKLGPYLTRPALLLALLLLLGSTPDNPELPATAVPEDSLAEHYQQLAARYRQADSLAAWVYCYWDWQAEVFEDNQQALAILEAARLQAWRSPRDAEEAEAWVWLETNRGYHLFQLGKVLASAQAYEAALEWYQAHPEIDFEALEYLYLPLGAHYTRLGDNEKARALYEAAISRYAGGRQEEGQLAGLYNNLGLTYWNEADFDAAIAWYEQGLANPGVPPIKEALLRLSLGQSLLDDGQIPAAQAQAARALALLRHLEAAAPDAEGLADFLAGAYLLQARLLGATGQPQQATPLWQQALVYGQAAWGNQPHRDIAKIWLEAGRLHLQAGAPQPALAAFQQALANLLPDFPADSLRALPRPDQLYAENSLYQALEGKADALWAAYQAAPQLDDLRLALDCHRLAGRAEGLLRRSLQYESSKLSLASQGRQRLAKAIALARELYDATGEEAWLYRAWADAEQAKAAVLLEAVQRSHLSDMTEQQDEDLAAARQLRQQAAYFERNMLLNAASPLRAEWLIQRDSLLRRLSDAEARLAERYPAWAAWQERAEGFGPGEIQAMRATMPGYHFLEYFVGESQIELFAQPPAGMAQWQRIALPDSLASQAQRLLELLRSRAAVPSPAAYGELAYGLYAQLLAPVLASAPAEGGKLVIVPDAWLGLLPFEALWVVPAGDGSWERAPFLLRQHSLHYAFSLAVLDAQRRLPARGGRNLLQLAPRFMAHERGLPPLAYSHEEAPVGCRSRQFLNKEASLARLQQAGGHYRVVHLSTHAGTDEAELLPRVELYDRPAYLPDIYALQLPAELVVLSACQTARGAFREGEGVMSLARAFAYAGAKGLVASLWAINESATADLSRRFYAHIQAGAAKPAALQDAKIAYLDDPEVPAFQKSPYYWAGMVYIGEEGALPWARCPLRKTLPLLAAALLLALAWWKAGGRRARKRGKR